MTKDNVDLCNNDTCINQVKDALDLPNSLDKLRKDILENHLDEYHKSIDRNIMKALVSNCCKID